MYYSPGVYKAPNMKNRNNKKQVMRITWHFSTIIQIWQLHVSIHDLNDQILDTEHVS